jgi:hypothetical protein
MSVEQTPDRRIPIHPFTGVPSRGAGFAVEPLLNVIVRLEALGLVRKKPSADDGRMKNVLLTARGVAKETFHGYFH